MAQSNFFDQFSDRQAIYNFVCQRLWEQNKCSYFNSQCLYRHGNLKCAIGHLIPDDMYVVNFENKSFNGFLDYMKENDYHPELVTFFEKFQGDDKFFSQMQYLLHDSIADSHGEAFRAILAHNAKEFAIKYDLIPYVFPSE